MKDGCKVKHPIQKDENTKPYFFCPRHKESQSRVHFPFPQEDIYPCTIKYCFCRHVNGWLAECRTCKRIVHNCVHGCKKGLVLLERDGKINDFIDHYQQYHDGQPVYLYY